MSRIGQITSYTAVQEALNQFVEPVSRPRRSRPWPLACALLLVLGLGSAPASALATAPSTRLSTLEPGKLKVCLYPGFQPFVGKVDGQWTGWDVTYLKEFAQEQELELVPVEIDTFADIWTLPGQNECDVAGSGISDLPSRRDQTGSLGDWSDHYYDVYRAYLVRAEDEDELQSVHDLVGQTVIVTGDSTADYDLVNRLSCAHIDPSTLTIERTTNEENAAAKVLSGEAFAYGGGLGSIQHLVETLSPQGLAVAWVHCNQQRNCAKATSEPFSFVVRHASTGVLDALNAFIGRTRYPGKPGTGPTCDPPET